jgi:hypothetical protein
MSDADREWTIEHAGEQLYDIISLLDYDETSVNMWGPTATDPGEGVTSTSRHGTAVNPHRQRLPRENDHGQNVEGRNAQEGER